MANPTQRSPAEVLRDVLISLSLGSTPESGKAWPVSANNEGDFPGASENWITVFDTESEVNKRTHADGEMVEHYGVQVRVRALGHQAGYTKAAAVRDALDAILNVTTISPVGSVTSTLHSVHRKGGVLSLGRGDQGSRRRVFTINALLTLSEGY